jgi:hypothetical protein
LWNKEITSEIVRVRKNGGGGLEKTAREPNGPAQEGGGDMEKNGAGRENSAGSREVRELLDGEVEPRPTGFAATTATRTLFVSYSVTRDAATALAICKERGLLIEKLEDMTAAQANLLYATTVAETPVEN